MPGWKIAVVILICVLVQVVLPGKVPGYHWLQVEWTLIAVIFFSLRRHWRQSMWIGAAAGLMLDLLSGGRLGVFGLSYLTCSTLLGVFHRWLYRESLFAICTLTFLVTLLVSNINFLILRSFGSYPGYWTYLIWGRLLPAATINAIFAAPFFILLSRIGHRFAHRQ